MDNVSSRFYKGKKGDSGRNSYQSEKRKPTDHRRNQTSQFLQDSDHFTDAESDFIVGRNAVRELLKSDHCVDKIFVQRGAREGSITVLVAEAIQRKIPVIEVEKQKLDAIAKSHQGIVAMAAAKEYVSIDDILQIARQRGEMPLIAIADGIVDPHNLGALIRCAECAGVHGLIIPKRRSAGMSSTVSKSSAGAIEHLAISKVPNLAAAIDQLKQKGLWIFAAEANGTSYHETDFSVPSAIIFGSEGEGVSKLLMSKCDFVVSIPLYGQINSLNVSAAAAVILNDAKAKQMAKQN